jgi:hypothetical protein
MKNKDYVVNGVVYNLNNIWEYMDKDYWDSDDLKFDFWYRLQRHGQIFYEVMKLNGKNLNNNNNVNYKDHTQELLDKMTEDNKHYNIKIVWED